MPLNASCLGKVAQFPFCKILNGALLPGSSALPQTPDYHPSAQNPVVSALSRTRLQQFGTNSACLSVLSNITLPQKPFSFQKPFLQCHCPEIQESVCVGWGGGGGCMPNLVIHVWTMLSVLVWTVLLSCMWNWEDFFFLMNMCSVTFASFSALSYGIGTLQMSIIILAKDAVPFRAINCIILMKSELTMRLDRVAWGRW